MQKLDFIALVSLVTLALTGCATGEKPPMVYRQEVPITQTAPPVVYAPAPVQAVPANPVPPAAYPGGANPEPAPAPAVVAAPVPSVQPAPVIVQQAPVVVQTAPPAPIVEPVPVSPGVEFVWTPGYWGWNGRWVWISGRWVFPPRPHAVWVHGHWIRHGGGWRWEDGRWR